MLEEKGPKGRPVGIRMAEVARNMLHTAFADAVGEGKLAANPCGRVANPPRTRYRADERPVLDRERAIKVLEAVRDSRYYLPSLLAMATGMRRKEIPGLTRDCVDLEAGVISRQLSDVACRKGCGREDGRHPGGLLFCRPPLQ